jgi:hypothetical protein
MFQELELTKFSLNVFKVLKSTESLKRGAGYGEARYFLLATGHVLYGRGDSSVFGPNLLNGAIVGPDE